MYYMIFMRVKMVFIVECAYLLICLALIYFFSLVDPLSLDVNVIYGGF
jgi:hypothetical protein